jgi:hypothetical protein
VLTNFIGLVDLWLLFPLKLFILKGETFRVGVLHRIGEKPADTPGDKFTFFLWNLYGDWSCLGCAIYSN